MPKLKLSFPTFRQAPSVICGTGSVRSLAEVANVPPRVLFMCSASESVDAAVRAPLEKAGVATAEIPWVCKPAGEPSWAGMEESAKMIGELRPEIIVAVGGGSVLDWARLSWARASGLLEAAATTSQTLPARGTAPAFYLVPSTCGTGAEAGDVAVYTTEAGSKAAVISSDFLARKVILDGRFLQSLDDQPGLLAGLVCDALSHGLEAGLSLIPNHLGKTYGAMAVRTILNNLPPALLGEGRAPDHATDPRSQRERLMEAGFLGGVAAANCSVGIVHAFSHSTGVAGVGHGLANAAALVAGLRFNAETEAMPKLLAALGIDCVETLVEQVRPIARTAMRQEQAVRLRELLGDDEARGAIVTRMASDVALRSNPRRPAGDDLVEFVGSVRTELEW